MKKILIWAITLLVLVAVNVLIVKKENTLAHGQTMLLRLAPVDPRSLIQGDYMVLRYAMARDISDENLKDKGCIVVSLDENHVARFVRVHTDEPLSSDEHLLFYRNRNGLKLGAESFMFQEGLADVYSQGRYGELVVDSSGKSVLVGLRDERFMPLKEQPVHQEADEGDALE